MARFGQGLIAALTNPGYADKLNMAGMLAGSMPGRLRDEREEKNNKLRQAQIASMMATGEGATAEAARKREMAQRTMTGQVASAPPELAAIAQAGAMKAGVKPTDVKAAAGMATQATQKNAWDKYLQSIGREELIGIDPKEAAKILKAEKDAQSKGDGLGTSTFASVGNFKDEEGNIYSVTEQRSRTGGVETIYNPITRGAPETPESYLTPIGGAYGVAAGDLAGMAGDKTAAQDFSKMKVGAMLQVPELEGALANLDEIDALLSRVDTGGPINIANTAIEGFLGTKSADKGELHVLAGEAMYSRLKPLFGGIISEGERQVIEGLYLSLRKGNPENEGILRALRRETERALQTANMIRRAESPEDFNILIDKLYPESSSASGDKVVNWSDRK